jgi:hypothetical protein
MTGAKSRQPATATTVIIDSESTNTNSFAACPPTFLELAIAAGEFPASRRTGGATTRSQFHGDNPPKFDFPAAHSGDKKF